jgi:hypothetical protein
VRDRFEVYVSGGEFWRVGGREGGVGFVEGGVGFVEGGGMPRWELAVRGDGRAASAGGGDAA